MKAQWAALISLGVAMLVALIVYGMPAGQTLLSASEGATFGLFPIMWIVIAAIWVYNMTVETGHFAVLRRSFGAISDDQRVQAVIVAFCFGALLEALAGLRHPRGHHRGDADRARLPADQGRLGRARGQHRPGGLRRDRHADHHARRGHRAAQGRPRRDGRPPDAGARADRAADPRVHGRRQARRAPGLAGGRDRRRCLRGRPVPRARTTSRSSSPTSWRRCSRPRSIVAFLRVWSPSEPLLGDGDGRFAQPAVAGGSAHSPELEREIARRDDGQRDSTARRGQAPTRPTRSSSPSSRSRRSRRSRTRSPSRPGPPPSSGPAWTW